MREEIPTLSSAGPIKTGNKTSCAALVLAGLYLFILVSTVGCGDESSALTDAELERIAITEKIQLVEKAGGLVLVVGGETITSDEIIQALPDQPEERKTVAEILKPMAQNTTLEEFKELAALAIGDVLTGKISGILLYQHAKREIGQGASEQIDKLAETELRKFVLRYGGDEARADEALAEKGMNREKFKAEHKKAIVTQSYLASKLQYKRPVTYSELAEYYEQHKDDLFYDKGLLKFRLIDIDISKIEITDIEENRTLKARKLAEEIAKRAKGGEDFAALAEQYSHGHRKSSGGLWPEVQPDSLARPYVVLAEAAEKMNPGDIAGPLETVGHIFVMKLEDKQATGYRPLEQVQGEVNNRILIDRRNEAITRLSAKLIREAEIGKTDEFVDFCAEKIYELSTKPANTGQGSK